MTTDEVARHQIVLEVVAIYKALAGGWQAAPAAGLLGEALPPVAQLEAGVELERAPLPSHPSP